MNVHGQDDNNHKLKLGPLNDNKGVEHLWNVSSTVAQAKQHDQIPSKSREWAIFCSLERHVWYAREGCGGGNAIQSLKLVDWDLTKDSRHLSSCQMTHVLNSIAKQWQILVHFSSFAMSIWRLFLGQFWYE